jgi:[acyl-carrier-protein] S-malonyltransferase
MLLLAAPGQGAQTPGFLGEWLELPGFADRLGALSELAGCDLIRCGTTAAVTAAAELLGEADQADELADAALAAGAGAAAGHSVGELAAGAIAGTLSAEDAIRLVRVRGQAMAQAAAAEPTGMTAVLGGDEQAVLASIEAHGLTPANVNGAGQIVAAGTLDQLAAFAADPPPGARLRPLSVAGAFHTRHMAPAVDALAAAAAGTVIKDPSITLLSNADGAVVTSGTHWVERIVAQVAAPVRWDLCMGTMSDMGVTALIELPPGGTLTGMAKRALPGVERLALKSPDQLDAARQLIAAHAQSTNGYPAAPADLAPAWRIVVSPRGGTFRSGETGEAPAVAAGATVPAGTVLGHVLARAGEQQVTAPYDAVLVEWLAEDGDPVGEGQPLVRLEPQESA